MTVIYGRQAFSTVGRDEDGVDRGWYGRASALTRAATRYRTFGPSIQVTPRYSIPVGVITSAEADAVGILRHISESGYVSSASIYPDVFLSSISQAPRSRPSDDYIGVIHDWMIGRIAGEFDPHPAVQASGLMMQLAILSTTALPQQPYGVQVDQLVRDARARTKASLADIVRSRVATTLAKRIAMSALGRVRRPASRIVSTHTGRPEPDKDTTLVHGTFASDAMWWHPDSPFPRYLESRMTSPAVSLYRGQSLFSWSGRLDFGPREQAAVELSAWCAHYLPNLSTLVAHSHGGNVAMQATHFGLQPALIVLLATPYCGVIPSGVERTVSLRVEGDPILNASGGPNPFTDIQRISSFEFPADSSWAFDPHTALRDESFWERNLIRQVAGL